MRFYGITMQGKFVNHTLDTVPLVFNTDVDPGRLIYTLDDGLLWWGDGESTPPRWRSISDGSGLDTGEAEDMYSDLLRTTVFMNGTWDDFDDTSANNPYIEDNLSDMVWDDVLHTYNYTAGLELVSTNLFDDPGITATEIQHCMPSVWWVNTSGTAVPQIYVNADGILPDHWEAVTNNDFHQFTYPGNILSMKVIIPSGDPVTGFIRSWGLLYNKDLSASCSRQALTRYEVTITTETFITTSYTVGAVLVYLNGVMLQDEEDYTADDGYIITIHSPALVAGDVVTVISYTTMVQGQDTIDFSPYLRLDGNTIFNGDVVSAQNWGGNKITNLTAGTNASDSVRYDQLFEATNNDMRHYRLYDSTLTNIRISSASTRVYAYVPIDCQGDKIYNVGNPTGTDDAMNWQYAEARYAPIAHVDQPATSSTYGHSKMSFEDGILRIDIS